MNNKGKTPMRQCIGCREMKNKKELIRILRTESGEIILDASGKKNGRGAYLCRNIECLEKACKSHGLDRSFKMTVPNEIYENLKRELESIDQ